MDFDIVVVILFRTKAIGIVAVLFPFSTSLDQKSVRGSYVLGVVVFVEVNDELVDTWGNGLSIILVTDVLNGLVGLAEVGKNGGVVGLLLNHWRLGIHVDIEPCTVGKFLVFSGPSKESTGGGTEPEIEIVATFPSESDGELGFGRVETAVLLDSGNGFFNILLLLGLDLSWGGFRSWFGSGCGWCFWITTEVGLVSFAE